MFEGACKMLFIFYILNGTWNFWPAPVWPKQERGRLQRAGRREREHHLSHNLARPVFLSFLWVEWLPDKVAGLKSPCCHSLFPSPSSLPLIPLLLTGCLMREKHQQQKPLSRLPLVFSGTSEEPRHASHGKVDLWMPAYTKGTKGHWVKPNSQQGNQPGKDFTLS